MLNIKLPLLFSQASSTQLVMISWFDSKFWLYIYSYCSPITTEEQAIVGNVGTPRLGYPFLMGLSRTLVAIHSHGVTGSSARLRV
jgi:hypothetical protein